MSTRWTKSYLYCFGYGSGFGLDMETEIYREPDLVRLLGVSKRELISMRGRALEGRHWYALASAKPKKLWAKVWTREGVEWIRSEMGLEVEVGEALKDAVPPKEHFGIVTAKYRNPRMIGCDLELNGKKEPVVVLVRDSRNFVPGMRVPLRRDGGRWVAAKHPRFGGKW